MYGTYICPKFLESRNGIFLLSRVPTKNILLFCWFMIEWWCHKSQPINMFLRMVNYLEIVVKILFMINVFRLLKTNVRGKDQTQVCPIYHTTSFCMAHKSRLCVPTLFLAKLPTFLIVFYFKNIELIQVLKRTTYSWKEGFSARTIKKRNFPPGVDVQSALMVLNILVSGQIMLCKDKGRDSRVKVMMLGCNW